MLGACECASHAPALAGKPWHAIPGFSRSGGASAGLAEARLGRV